MFDEDILKFFKKLAYLEMHPNLWHSLSTFMRGKGQVLFQDYETTVDNLMVMGSEIAQYDIGWGNNMEGQLARSWRDIKKTTPSGYIFSQDSAQLGYGRGGGDAVNGPLTVEVLL